jgi:dUTP pyrophosphatase
MKVKIKKLDPEAVLPFYSKPGDAGMDLTATSKEYNSYTHSIKYGTGIAIEIPEGYVGLLFPRSSICRKELILSNSVGVIDSGYRGEISFDFKMIVHPDRDLDEVSDYRIGDRIGQIIILPYPQIEFEEVEELSTTERNTGGFGSTGV